jgi:hypothetical protein
MKKFKFSLAWLTVLALVFTSCSKEETGVVTDDQEKIQVTFGSLLNDFNSQNKQAEPGECSDADPAYIHVAITDSNGMYIGDDDGIDVPNINFIPVDLKWNPNIGEEGVWETVYTDALALEAGDYTLEYFVVFDADNNPIWVAPRSDGAYGSNVGNPLPNDFTLDPGTKPYITVDVLCYIPRNEEAFGYLFFDINRYWITNNYCLFVNYCADDGRDYPAYFSVDVWTEGYESGIHVIDGWTNDITMSGGLPAASVLCLPLPELMGDDTYFVTVTVMDHANLDYSADVTDVKQFEINQAMIDDQLNAEPAYEHVRFECGEDTGGGDEGECEVAVACELDRSGDLQAGCYYTEDLEGADGDGFLRIDSAEDLADLNLLVQFGNVETAPVIDVDIDLTSNAITVNFDTPYAESDQVAAYAIEVRPSVDGGAMSETCWESRCANVAGDARFGPLTVEPAFTGYQYDYPFYVKIEATFCGETVN